MTFVSLGRDQSSARVPITSFSVGFATSIFDRVLGDLALILTRTERCWIPERNPPVISSEYECSKSTESLKIPGNLAFADKEAFGSRVIAV